MAKVIWRDGKAVLCIIMFGISVFSVAQADLQSESTTLPELQQLEQAAIIHIKQADFTQAEVKLEQLWTEHRSAPKFVKRLRRVVQAYWSAGKVGAHQALCARISTEFPDHSMAPLMLGYEICGCIKLNDKTGAEEKLEQLWTKYRSAPRFVESLHNVVEAYWDAGEVAAYHALCGRILTEFPDHSLAPEILAHEIGGRIKLNDMTRAEIKTDELFTKYNQTPGFANVVIKVARNYEDGKRYDQARQMYNYVSTNWPLSDAAIWAKVGVSILDSEICSNGLNTTVDPNSPGDPPDITGQGKVDIESILSEFEGHPELATAVFFIAERYYSAAFEKENQGFKETSQKFFLNTIELLERIKTEFSNISPSWMDPEACQIAGECHRRLGQNAEAIRNFKEVITKWPDYEYAWYMQFLLGDSYQQMKKTAAMAADEADNKTRTAYERLIAEYPKCKVAKITRKWLERN